MSPSPVVMIGLDACDPTLARELAASGRMPALASLLASGAAAETRNPYGFFVGAIWPTFTTANSVTKTNFHCWEEIEAGTYERRLTKPEGLGPPFWRAIADAGHRVAVVDVPHHRAEGAAADSIEVSEWGCHDRHFGLHSSPPELAGELEREHGLHPVLGIDGHAEREFAPDDYFAREDELRSAEEERRLAAALLEGAEGKRRISLELLERSRPDLFISVFGESHAIGHQLWHAHDPGHPRHDPERARADGDPVAELYAQLDRAVADHVEAAGPGTTVVVLLSHGMSDHFDGTHMLHEVLRRIDAYDSDGHADPTKLGAARRAYLRLPAAVRRGARRPIAALVRADARRRELPEYWAFGEEDPASQRFFNTPNNTVYGGIRLNLAGREPDGKVQPGAELERVRERLAEDLLELVNVDTGEPAVATVTRTEDHYERAELDAFPDLIVDWNRSAPIETVWSPKTGVVRAPYKLWRTGDHRLEGLLVARGPGIEPGPKSPLAIEDLGPSLAARLGVELDGVDGRPASWLAGG